MAKCFLPPPPLSKHAKRQKNDSQTAHVLRQARACTRHAAPKRTYFAENLPVPHPNHNCCNRARQHYVQANFSMFWRSSLPVRGISSCGIEALSNVAPHLEFGAGLWSRLGFTRHAPGARRANTPPKGLLIEALVISDLDDDNLFYVFLFVYSRGLFQGEGFPHFQSRAVKGLEVVLGN